MENFTSTKHITLIIRTFFFLNIGVKHLTQWLTWKRKKKGKQPKKKTTKSTQKNPNCSKESNQNITQEKGNFTSLGIQHSILKSIINIRTLQYRNWYAYLAYECTTQSGQSCHRKLLHVSEKKKKKRYILCKLEFDNFYTEIKIKYKLPTFNVTLKINFGNLNMHLSKKNYIYKLILF